MDFSERSNRNNIKTACRKMCDSSPQAYKLWNEKARLRSLDTRNPTFRLREQAYQRHLKALKTAKPIVDTKPPLVPKGGMHTIFRDNRSGICNAKIEFDNAKLLHALACTYNGSWKTELQNRLVRPAVIRNRTYERAIKTMKMVHENLKQHYSIQQAKPVYPTSEFQKWYAKQKKHKDRISKYPDISKLALCSPTLKKVIGKARANPVQYAFILVEVEDKMAENVVIELYADLCPFTVKNFQRLCTNTRVAGCDSRCYRCKKLNRLHCVQMNKGKFKKMYWVVAENSDSAPEFIAIMLKECSPISHTEAGLVTRPKHLSGGVFFITTGPCPFLDEFCYVFGKVTENGMSYLSKLENKNLEDNGQPIIQMHITDCGLLKSPDKVPPPMLLRDFVAQVRLEITPFIRRNPENADEWVGGKTAFADYLKERYKEAVDKFSESVIEGRSYAGDNNDRIADAI